MSNKLLVRRAAVLGAGVMGAQIAAHLTNAGVDTVLFDLPAKEGDPNGVVDQGHRQPRASSAPPRSPTRRWPTASSPANYDSGPGAAARLRPDHRGDRRTDGLEAGPVQEDRAVRRRRTRCSPATPRAWASTSWPKCCPKQLRHRFCGVHFFNPPRYMHLAELIPARTTDAAGARRPRNLPDHHARQGRGLRQGHAELHRQPHRRVLDAGRRCTTPQQFGLGFDDVDALTGPAIGRPKSATYRTADVVGLDTMAHVIKTMADTLPDDPWHQYFQAPEVAARR